MFESISHAEPLRLVLKAIILLLAGLLIFYHATMLVDLFRGQGLSSDARYNAIQGVLRLAIMVSLILVVAGKREALPAMWISIAGLVATQYWAHWGNLPVDFTAGRHPLSYLKGFIFPSIITAAFLYRAA
ncbi:hypothetical protein K3181_02460 [Qipengyuania sp. YG27]|uniref:Uncharacterized protein n=1 Tax=Qipengyuania mesophila TaxID=2867246 RepID=A0ABS7JRS6_9SPHN|nr:hypothetical protein [Qipengyuania mesophila]MBX7500307.1 hypothetical protein [Qipengyuania mesophila]